MKSLGVADIKDFCSSKQVKESENSFSSWDFWHSHAVEALEESRDLILASIWARSILTYLETYSELFGFFLRPNCWQYWKQSSLGYEHSEWNVKMPDTENREQKPKRNDTIIALGRDTKSPKIPGLRLGVEQTVWRGNKSTSWSPDTPKWWPRNNQPPVTTG